jgi:DNA-directed RNA polymerase specialized sigma24 family protein
MTNSLRGMTLMADQTPPSLLERLRQEPIESDSWRRLLELYAPWLESWLGRLTHLSSGDRDEVIRGVLLLLAREADAGQHNGRPGGFRAWFRKTFVDCLREHVRKQSVGIDGLEEQLDQLADPVSELSRTWDHEHHTHVVSRLIERGKKLFTAYTWEAFRRTVLVGQTPSQAGAEMKVTALAVMQARARVLAWMRKEAEDLLA